MTNVKTGDRFPPNHIVALLDLGSRRVRRELVDRLDWAELEGLRPTLLRLLSIIPPTGGRPTDLAVTAHMTKQGFGQFVRQLVGLGYAEFVSDPDDRRARLVCRTARGDAAVAAADAAIEAFEDDLRAEVGADLFAAFRDVLSRLAARDPLRTHQPGGADRPRPASRRGPPSR